MKRSRIFAALALAGFAGAAAAQDIVFFNGNDFSGRRFGANATIQNLAESGFNDRASSVVVNSGTWQLCTDANFRGRCVTLQPGQYPSLNQIGLSNQISSARELGFVPGPQPDRRASVTLYEDFGFRGTRLDVDHSLGNLSRSDFNDRARSMIVHEGTWEVCADAGFRGGCQTFGPGRHANLGPLAASSSSLRPVGAGGDGHHGPGWGGRDRVVLFEQPGFNGRRIAIDNEFLPNLASTGFNDRASSLRIERGYWMFCSDAGFQGTCRTFGPGDYAQLPPGLNDRISSGRKISDDYPYNAGPNWQQGQRDNYSQR